MIVNDTIVQMTEKNDGSNKPAEWSVQTTNKVLIRERKFIVAVVLNNRNYTERKILSSRL